MESVTTPLGCRSAWRRILWLGVCSAPLVGCGSPPPFEMVPVTGSVQYSDGTPIAAPHLELVFIPVIESVAADGTGPRSARAIVNAKTGVFEHATTWSTGDGAIAGEHKLVVIARDQKGRQHPAVAGKYAAPNSTPLTVKVARESMPLKIQVEPEPQRNR